ncbi:MAG: type I glutamate--ammonia ligase [Nitrososphaerota archaeon]|nr:type I glutamate--ammonia ligase [Nitrososphaerota archaeon]
MKRTAQEVMDIIKREGVRFIDLQFTDLIGRFHHVTVPSSTFKIEVFRSGIPKLDGSAVKGFTEIYESDMVLLPDPTTFALIPWSSENLKVARFICDVYWGSDRGRFSRDPRLIAQRAEQAILELGYDYSYWGPEIEFFVFDRVTWDTLSPYRGQTYAIESKEGAWSSGGANYLTRFREGYYSTPPQDTLMDFRNECTRLMEEYFGMAVEAHHHEVATAGQCEINLCFDNLVNMADNVMSFKYVVKNVAHSIGKVATFMPKPIYGDNASGMHTHVSLWKGNENVFYDPNDEYAELSQTARYFGGGLMEHSRALAAIVAPTTNSYKRLVPGYEAPVYIAWSIGNRSASIRIPIYRKGERFVDEKRIEYRPPDPSTNPYLCFSAIVAAGIDGIKKKIDMGGPIDEDIYKLTPERRKQLGIKELPGSLREAIECLECDHEFLRPIFSKDAIETYIELKKKEAMEVDMRPHPHEFYLYFDI